MSNEVEKLYWAGVKPDDITNNEELKFQLWKRIQDEIEAEMNWREYVK